MHLFINLLADLHRHGTLHISVLYIGAKMVQKTIFFALESEDSRRCLERLRDYAILKCYFESPVTTPNPKFGLGLCDVFI